MSFARNFDRAMATRRTRSWAALLIVAALVGISTERLLRAGDARQARAGAGASAPTAAGCVSSADVVCTDTGAVRGSLSSDVRVFKGIPYAKPPVGNLRFRPTQPADHWQGIRAADQFGSICPQVAGDKVMGSEDCLPVNVWTPQQPPATPLPVMIWLHGGGNRGSSGSLYDGSLMVRRGVVFLTYNLRLGVLGFMAHASLDAERPEKISGNYGNLDQIAMLQ